MGQYFKWVNFTKQQYLGYEPFKAGLKVCESAYVGCDLTDAASTLLAGDWKGDDVAFYGEYASEVVELFDTSAYPRLTRIAGHPIDPYDIDYDFEDVAGMFTCARKVRHFRYVVNESKGEYYDRTRTDPGHWRDGRVDILPIVMGTSWGHLAVDGEASPVDGIWLGDIVVPTDEEPPRHYVDVSSRYTIPRRQGTNPYPHESKGDS